MSDNNQPIPPAEIPIGQPTRQSSFEARRRRGGCLTTILVLFVIITLHTMYSLFNSLLHPFTAYDRSIFPFISIFLIATNLISLYGIWTWKKWGVKLLVIAYILGALISIIVEITLHIYDSLFQSRFLTLSFIINFMLGISILIFICVSFFLEVKKRWQYFS